MERRVTIVVAVQFLVILARLSFPWVALPPGWSGENVSLSMGGYTSADWGDRLAVATWRCCLVFSILSSPETHRSINL